MGESALQEFVGFKFDPYHFVVERGKIKELALAIGDDNPIYYDEQAAKDAGFRDIPILPTFPTVMEFWEGPELQPLLAKLQLNPLKILHGEQQYTFLADICAGDHITGNATVTGAEQKGNMKFITIETEYKNQNDEAVLKSRFLIIERG